MSKGSEAWQDGRKVWDRLAGWDEDGTAPKDGGAALGALEDIGRLRHLLDQAELGAVRTARGCGRSWAEIATKLGITRQSAWERWSDLDAPPPQPAAGEAAHAAVTELAEARLPDRRTAREMRRRSTVKVPDVIGKRWNEARIALERRGLRAVAGDPGGPPVDVLQHSQRVVTGQSPEWGARVAPGTAVRLWTERGGGAGVREPRRPRPQRGTGREMQAEPSDEAIS